MRTFLVMLVLCCVGAGSADAQRRRVPDRDGFDWTPGPVQFGVRGGHSFDERVASAGAQLRWPLVTQLLLVPSADVFLGDAAQVDWQLNADAVVTADGLGGLYGGMGVAFLNHDHDDADDEEDDVETGYNLFVGLDGNTLFDSSMEPFVEARWTYVDDFTPFRLVAGINVPIR